MGLGEGSKNMKKQVKKHVRKTKSSQQLLNAEIRLAVRKGELPFTFVDNDEKTYRKIVYQLAKETGQKLSCTKIEDKWIIDIA